MFLRRELSRLGKEQDDFLRQSTLSSVRHISQLAPDGLNLEDFTEYVATREIYAARLAILRDKLSSCESGEALSSPNRLPRVEVRRGRHVATAKKNWVTLGGGPDDDGWKKITGRLNAFYDDEARSFYNSGQGGDDIDRDIAKDYPDLLNLITASSLPSDLKRSLAESKRFIRYEEAGQLYNILRGLEPDRGTGYAYLLWQNVGDRVRRAQAQARTAAAKQRAAERRLLVEILGAV